MRCEVVVAYAMFTKNHVSRCLNGLLFLGGCFLLGSGWLLGERMPHGRGAGQRGEFLGAGRHDWSEWHEWAGYAMAVAVAVHLVMHARWLHKIAAQNRRWRWVAGVGLGAVIVGVFMIAPVGR